MAPEVVTAGLALLTAVDLVLSVWILFGPRSFLNVLHGSTVPMDPFLTRRTGGFWLGFTILQGVCLVLWTNYPGLLLVVAGVRFSEGVADWLLLTGPDSFTGMGRLGYSLSVPYTLGFGFLLLQEALRLPGAALQAAPFTLPSTLAIPDPAIPLLLVVVLGLDAVRAVVAIGRPGFWAWWYHGRERQDCGGLLRRAGGVWAGMALVEFLVLILFWRSPLLLLLVLGIRSVDLLPPLFSLFTGRRVTLRGFLSAGLVTLLNLFVILVFTATILA